MGIDEAQYPVAATLLDMGLSLRAISRQLGCHHSTVSAHLVAINEYRTVGSSVSMANFGKERIAYLAADADDQKTQLNAAKSLVELCPDDDEAVVVVDDTTDITQAILEVLNNE